MPTGDRRVWIVGDIDAGARAGDQRYHDGHCYVLDQIGNRDRKQRVALGSLPLSFEPCRICAPGSRRMTSAAMRATDPTGPAAGIRPGHEVEIEDLQTGRVSAIRICDSGRVRRDGEITPESPIGAALLGKSEGESAEFSTPSGSVRRLRVLRFG